MTSPQKKKKGVTKIVIRVDKGRGWLRSWKFSMTSFMNDPLPNKHE